MVLRFSVTAFTAATVLMCVPSKAQTTRFHNAPEETKKSKNPYAGEQHVVEAGAQLYANHCASCHGLRAQGTGNVPALASGPTQSATSGEPFWYIAPGTDELWCSVNERDGLGDNLVPDYITHATPGGFYGWPSWYVGGHQDPRHNGKHPELKEKIITPDVILQPHNASLQMTFYEGKQFPAEYQGVIFASEHGSWNKSVRAGYEVIRVPLH